MKVLVCGGRNYSNVDKMYSVLDTFPITTIISGHARGADQMAEMYADERDIAVEVYPADWSKHGKAAGFIRNKQMLDEGKPDLVVAFPGGKGTSMMVDIARKAGVTVEEIEE